MAIECPIKLVTKAVLNLTIARTGRMLFQIADVIPRLFHSSKNRAQTLFYAALKLYLHHQAPIPADTSNIAASASSGGGGEGGEAEERTSDYISRLLL